MLKKLGVALFILASLASARFVYAETSNSGFVPTSLWYSKVPFEEWDKIKIYTFIFNPEDRQLSGTVDFFDKDVLLGKKDFKIPAQAADDVFINWTVTAGSHSIFAKIENAKLLTPKGTYEPAELKDAQTKVSIRTVSKKVKPGEAGDPSKIGTEESSAIPESLRRIENTLEENTPEFISKPLIRFIDSLEDSRLKMSTASRGQTQEVKDDIASLNDPDSNTLDKNNLFLKPFKYIEIFFLSIFTFITGHSIIFYGTLVVLIFVIVRHIWLRFF